MMNRWLLTLLIAPPLSPAVMPLEAYSVYWYLLETDPPAAADGDWNDLAARPPAESTSTPRETR
jgi:hypothetical protein